MAYKKRIFAVLISIIILFLLFRIVDIGDIIDGLRKISFTTILLAAFFYTLSYVFRATRFKSLNKKKINLSSLFIVVCLHNFYNNLLPARTGEFSYIYLMKKRNIPIGQGAGSLIIARLLDLLFILIIILGMLFIIRESSSYLIQGAILIIPLVLVISLPFLFIRFQKGLIRKLKSFLSWIGLNEQGAKNIISKFEEMVDSLVIIKSKGVFLGAGISTLLIFTSQYLFFYFLLIGLGIDLNFTKIILAVAIVLIVHTFPIQGVAGFGTYEGAWALSLMYLGISRELSVTAGFVIHLVQIVFFVALGIVGFLLSHMQRN